jgi:hypothetical protein
MTLIQKIPWKGGRISFMKYRQGDVHCITIEVCKEEFGSYWFDGSDLVDHVYFLDASHS